MMFLELKHTLLSLPFWWTTSVGPYTFHEAGKEFVGETEYRCWKADNFTMRFITQVTEDFKGKVSNLLPADDFKEVPAILPSLLPNIVSPHVTSSSDWFLYSFACKIFRLCDSLVRADEFIELLLRILFMMSFHVFLYWCRNKEYTKGSETALL